MKCKRVLESVALVLLVALRCSAQNESFSFIPSEHLNITCNKTTNLVFPYSVQSIDRGTKDILVQQPKGTENIVQVKAGKSNFIQTNLSVITTDGKLYSFIVDYKDQPAQLNIIVQKGDSLTNNSPLSPVVKLTSANNKALFQATTQKISETKARHLKRNRNSQIELRLNGIYINRDAFYFRFQLKNNSNISYETGDVRFTIKDRQKSRRTATQETEITPVYKFGSIEYVSADSVASSIIVLPKFTLPDSKYLFIHVLEKNGERDLNFIIKSREIIKAINIDSYTSLY